MLTKKYLVIPAVLMIVLIVCALNGVRAFFVVTGSMNPAIPPNSLILVRPMPNSDAVPGRVVVFNDHAIDRVVTHRLVTTGDLSKITTKGDANIYQDPGAINFANIIGGVVAVIPIGTAPMMLLQALYLVSVYLLAVIARRFCYS